MIKRTKNEKILLSLSLLTVMTISPFSYLRWLEGDITLAIVDAIISITAMSFFIFIYITRKIDTAKILFSISLVISTLSTILIKGASQVLWASPAIIALHYLMPLKLARITSTILILGILIITYPIVDLLSFLNIAATTGLTAAFSFVIFRSYNEKQLELSLLASIDSLTSSGNRRALDLKLIDIIVSQNREARAMCLILIDLDSFKAINDEYGHAAGDQILISVCELITQHVRLQDSLYRYGGDEFIITPVNTNIETTKALAEKIRHMVEQHRFVNELKMTLSIGVAQYREGDTPESWIGRADNALYKAKENGRNNVCCE